MRLPVKRSHAKPGGPRRCCPDQPGVCVEWRAQNAYLAAAPAAAPAGALAAGAAAAAPAPGAPAAALGGARALAPAVAPGVVTDFCSFPGQICTTNGTLLRLDMRGFNLQCPFPVPEMSTFTALTTVNLGRNPNMTARPPSLAGRPGRWVLSTLCVRLADAEMYMTLSASAAHMQVIIRETSAASTDGWRASAGMGWVRVSRGPSDHEGYIRTMHCWPASLGGIFGRKGQFACVAVSMLMC